MQAMNFTNSEKAALVAFLKTLTDHHFLSDPKFSDPFKSYTRRTRRSDLCDAANHLMTLLPSPWPPRADACAVNGIPDVLRRCDGGQATSPDVVVARVMSFDRDNDGRVTKEDYRSDAQLVPGPDGETLDSDAVRARAMTAVAATAATATGAGSRARVATRLVIRSASQRARTWKERGRSQAACLHS